MENSSIQNTSDFNFNLYLPLISSIVVIILFVIERRLSYKIRKHEIKRTWYYNVLIKPSLNKIDNFFNYSLNLYIESCKFLFYSHELPNLNYISISNNEIGKLQKEARSIYENIIYPIILHYLNIGEKLQENLGKINDLYSKNIIEKKFTEDDISNFQNEIYKIRGKFYITLYELNTEGI